MAMVNRDAMRKGVVVFIVTSSNFESGATRSCEKLRPTDEDHHRQGMDTVLIEKPGRLSDLERLIEGPWYHLTVSPTCDEHTDTGSRAVRHLRARPALRRAAPERPTRAPAGAAGAGPLSAREPSRGAGEP